MSTALEATVYQRLREHLSYLELTAAAEHLGAELDRAQTEKASATPVLERLLDIEVQATRARRLRGRLRGRLRFARYPIHKTLADFDFDFQPSRDRAVMAELSTLRFVEEKRNVLLLGPPGVGKTHLATALGIAATEAGYRTYFISAAELVANLQSAHLEGAAAYKMRTYTLQSTDPPFRAGSPSVLPSPGPGLLFRVCLAFAWDHAVRDSPAARALSPTASPYPRSANTRNRPSAPTLCSLFHPHEQFVDQPRGTLVRRIDRQAHPAWQASIRART